MRTIKFRAKNRLGNWVYGVPCPFEGRKDDEPILFMSYWLDENDILHETKYAIDDTKTIGQFTSLYDRNKKEIYEGDILRASDVGVLEVRFVRGVFAFLWNGNLDDEFPTGSPTHEWAEVVGNIHDNPELLKGGEK